MNKTIVITVHNVNAFLNKNCFWLFRTFQPRPRRLLSADGKTLVNLWFIPHYTEVLLMFRNLEEKVRNASVTNKHGIVSQFSLKRNPKIYVH